MYAPKEFKDAVSFSSYLAKRYRSKRTDARNRKLEFTLTLIDFIKLFKRKTCAYTGIVLTYPVDQRCKDTEASIDRKDNTKGYTKENTVLCTFRVNRAKGALSLKELKKIVEVLEKDQAPVV